MVKANRMGMLNSPDAAHGRMQGRRNGVTRKRREEEGERGGEEGKGRRARRWQMGKRPSRDIGPAARDATAMTMQPHSRVSVPRENAGSTKPSQPGFLHVRARTGGDATVEKRLRQAWYEREARGWELVSFHRLQRAERDRR